MREFDDGFVYADGGAVRTTRIARREIDASHDRARAAHRRFVERPVAILEADGSLTPIDYGPYGPGGSMTNVVQRA